MKILLIASTGAAFITLVATGAAQAAGFGGSTMDGSMMGDSMMSGSMMIGDSMPGMGGSSGGYGTSTDSGDENYKYYWTWNDPKSQSSGEGYSPAEKPSGYGKDYKPVPEPTSALGVLAFGVLGAGSLLKRKQKQQKST